LGFADRPLRILGIVHRRKVTRIAYVERSPVRFTAAASNRGSPVDRCAARPAVT
jgi:hypothetical protein